MFGSCKWRFTPTVHHRVSDLVTKRGNETKVTALCIVHGSQPFLLSGDVRPGLAKCSPTVEDDKTDGGGFLRPEDFLYCFTVLVFYRERSTPCQDLLELFRPTHSKVTRESTRSDREHCAYSMGMELACIPESHFSVFVQLEVVTLFARLWKKRFEFDNFRERNECSSKSQHIVHCSQVDQLEYLLHNRSQAESQGLT